MRAVKEPPRRVARIRKVPIYHEGTFQAIVSTAHSAGPCLSYRGESWQPIEESPSFGLYLPAAARLRLIQERVDSYEFHFYSRLLQSHFGQDGTLRPHTQLRRAPNGALVSQTAAATAGLAGGRVGRG